MTAAQRRDDEAASPPPAKQRKRIKWEPAALMCIVVGLGLWIAFGPASAPKFDLRPNAQTQDVRIGDTRGVLEAAPDASGTPTFRLLLRDQPTPSSTLSRAQAEAIFGPKVVESTLTPRTNQVFRWLNITSWISLVWIGIGLAGQLLFTGRMVLSWIVSEKRRESTIHESFWWFSLGGGLLLFSYFIWRQDPVAMLGQAFGLVIYARNIRLIYKKKRRDARTSAES